MSQYIKFDAGIGEMYDDLNQSFSLEELDDWKTAAGLTEAAIAKIKLRLPEWNIHLFVHASEHHEYRELNREGVSSFPDDSLFIACLAMQDKALSVSRLFSDNNLEEPMLVTLLQAVYRARWICPMVHRFRLLGFVLLCHPDTEKTPTDEEIVFMQELCSRLCINLYAASIADERQRSLLALAEFPGRLRSVKSIREVLGTMLDELGSKIPYDRAVYYSYNDYRKVLVPRNWRGLSGRPPLLKQGDGISGIVMDRRRAIAVQNRADHPVFSSCNGETFFEGSFVSAPLYNEHCLFGVVTLCRLPQHRDYYSMEQRYILEIAASFVSAELDSRRLYEELEYSYFSTISSLTRALEAKDQYTRGHSERVMELATGIARELKLTADSVRRIRYAAMLHDIGKIGISDSLINKTEELDADEYEQIKRHTEIGYQIVDDASFLAEIRDLIRYHHEKFDGSGYYGKQAGNYPWEAMIISIADIYDALTSIRPYRKAMHKQEALNYLFRLVNIHFDLTIFEAFCRVLGVENNYSIPGDRQADIGKMH